tara:strand:- start:1038 stop:1460 length:423 start_codon:yes stop_codon:yes gene_type:complete
MTTSSSLGNLNMIQPQSIIVAASDETTAITTGTAKTTWRMPYPFQILSVKASLTTAGGTSGTTTIDVNDDTVSIFSTLLTIDQGELSSVTAAIPYVLAATGYTILPDSSMTIDVDAISGGGSETGLKVELIGYPLGARIS